MKLPLPTLAAALACIPMLLGRTAHAEGTTETQALEKASHEDDESSGGMSGGQIGGVVLMAVGFASAAAGITIILVKALESTGETPQDTAADPGLSGVRGRAGVSPVSESDPLGPITVALIGGGAVLHAVGVGLYFTSDDSHDGEDRPAEARRGTSRPRVSLERPPPPRRAGSVQAFVGPGYGSVQVPF